MKGKIYYYALLALLSIPFITQKGFGSGGWVGNSPAQLYAYNSRTFHSPIENQDQAEGNTYDQDGAKNESGDENSGKSGSWNSLLLRKGETRWNLGNTFGRGSSFFEQRIGYDWGVTENLTSFTLLNWGYNLKAGNGQGSEWALLFGLNSFPWYYSKKGLVANPNIGIAYAYTYEQWRFVSSLKTFGEFYFSRGEFSSNGLRWNNKLSYKLSENWAFGISNGSSFSRRHFCGGIYEVNCEEGKTYLNPFVNPSLSVTRRFAEDVELTIGVGTNLDHLSFDVSW
jgi:hypothetical protein